MVHSFHLCQSLLSLEQSSDLLSLSHTRLTTVTPSSVQSQHLLHIWSEFSPLGLFLLVESVLIGTALDGRRVTFPALSRSRVSRSCELRRTTTSSYEQAMSTGIVKTSTRASCQPSMKARTVPRVIVMKEVMTCPARCPAACRAGQSHGQLDKQV